MTYLVWKNNNWGELCMWVIYMTHLKDDMKSEFVDRIFFLNFCVGVELEFQKFWFHQIKTKFPIEWYLYLVFFILRIGNIADFQKIYFLIFLYLICMGTKVVVAVVDANITVVVWFNSSQMFPHSGYVS